MTIAAQNNHWSVVLALLAAGKDVNKAEPDDAVLLGAAWKGEEVVMRRLLEANADVNAPPGSGEAWAL
jgi:hypothetical protein